MEEEKKIIIVSHNFFALLQSINYNKVRKREEKKF